MALALIKCFRNGLDQSRIHLLGFSLGAHICAEIGRTAQCEKYMIPRLDKNVKIFEEKNATVTTVCFRITGLDPAYPLYYGTADNKELYKNDAARVDIIHSDKGICGGPTSTGHVDFYPNGGTRPQPMCVSSLPPWLLLLTCGMNYRESQTRRLIYLMEYPFLDHCSHDASVHYFADSVLARGNKFLATNRLNSSLTAAMGYDCPITYVVN